MDDISALIGSLPIEVAVTATAQCLSNNTNPGFDSDDYLTIPNDVEDGDLAILMHTCLGSTVAPPPTFATPSGWTAISNAADTSTRVGVYRKFLTVSDRGDQPAGMIGQFGEDVILVVLRGVASIISTSTPVTASGSGDPSDQTISANGQSSPLLAIVARYHVSPTTFTLTPHGFDFNVAAAAPRSRLAGGIIDVGEAPVNYTVDCDGSNAYIVQSFYLKVN